MVELLMTLTRNRVLSGLLAVIYLIGAAVTGGGEAGLKALIFVILPLACIWLGDAMGGFTGLSWNIRVTAPSSGLFICLAGWALLLLPLAFIIL
jgi:hypothetical protein